MSFRARHMNRTKLQLGASISKPERLYERGKKNGVFDVSTRAVLVRSRPLVSNWHYLYTHVCTRVYIYMGGARIGDVSMFFPNFCRLTQYQLCRDWVRECGVLYCVHTRIRLLAIYLSIHETCIYYSRVYFFVSNWVWFLRHLYYVIERQNSASYFFFCLV